MIIGLTQQKGGCSKSTTAFHLVHWLHKQGKKVALVDVDPQATSSWWLQASSYEIPFFFLEATSDVVLEEIPKVKAEYDYVVVDGPAGLSDTIRAVLLLADLALIPVQPSGADVRSAVDAVRLVHQARRIRGGQPDAKLFISRATRGTRLLTEARSVLSQLEDITLLNSTITQRQVVADAFGQATSVLNATTGPGLESGNEFNQLFKEVFHGHA